MINKLQNTGLVSVIIPCYNQGMFLGEALISILEQSYDNWECIIVNNGSYDNTEDVIQVYMKKDVRFRYLSIENKGVSHARNLGIQKAMGEFFQFLDADDLLEKEKLKTHAVYLKQNNEVDLVYGEARYFTSEDNSIRKYSMHLKDVDWMPRVSGKGNKLVTWLLKRNIFPINAPLFRKALVENFGAFDEDLIVLEDWDLWVRFALNGAGFQWADVPNTSALIRIHAASASQNKTMMRSHILPLLQRNIFHSGTNLGQKIYLFVRYEEELTDVLCNVFKGSFQKILLSKTKSVFTFFFLLCFVIPFFPFYILIKIYRKLFQ